MKVLFHYRPKNSYYFLISTEDISKRICKHIFARCQMKTIDNVDSQLSNDLITCCVITYFDAAVAESVADAEHAARVAGVESAGDAADVADVVDVADVAGDARGASAARW